MTDMASRWGRADGVVPFAVEVVRLDVETGELVVRDGNGLLVEMAVEGGLDAEPRLGHGVPDEAEDGFDPLEWSTAPVLRDVAEHPVLDLVPLARARRVVRDGHVEARLVGEALEFQFPQSGAVAVAAAAVSGEQQARSLGVHASSHA